VLTERHAVVGVGRRATSDSYATAAAAAAAAYFSYFASVLLRFYARSPGRQQRLSVIGELRR